MGEPTWSPSIVPPIVLLSRGEGGEGEGEQEEGEREGKRERRWWISSFFLSYSSSEIILKKRGKNKIIKQ